MAKLNVLLLIYKLEVAGAEKVVVTLAKGLDRGKFNPVVCCFKNGPLAEEIREANIPVYVLDKKGKFDFCFIFRLLKVIKQEKVDILHTHTFSPNFWGRIVGKLCAVPVIIITEHTICSHKKKLQKYLDKILLGFSSKVIAVSEQVRKSHIHEEKIAPNKIVTIYNGIENIHQNKTLSLLKITEKKRELGLNPDGPVIITVGRLEPPKGHKYLLNAIKIIVELRSDVKFLIVGDGPLKKELEDLSVELNIINNVCFVGFRSDIFELLQFADIVVLSSVREGFSITLLEAMSVGKPLVVTDVGGNKEAISDGETGILVPPKDPAALSEAITRLLEDKQLRQKMGEKGKLRFENKFTSKIMIKNVEDLYMGLLS